MNPISVESFHTILRCRKWDACVSFYRDTLGFEVVYTRPGFVELQIAAGSRIGLIKQNRKNEPKNPDASVILSFRVENVEKAYEILAMRCKGALEVRQHPWGARLFELRDPEGRRLEFWTPQ